MRCHAKAILRLLGVTIILLIPVAGAAELQTLPALRTPIPAPDFNLPDDSGNMHRLGDYRGKVVVLNFWATWCPPCRKEMPSMERAWRLLEQEGVMLLGINVGETASAVFEFTGQYPLSFPLLLDLEGKVVKDYPVTGLPSTYVIDAAGNITHRAIGSREWDDPALLKILRAIKAAGNKS